MSDLVTLKRKGPSLSYPEKETSFPTDSSWKGKEVKAFLLFVRWTSERRGVRDDGRTESTTLPHFVFVWRRLTNSVCTWLQPPLGFTPSSFYFFGETFDRAARTILSLRSGDEMKRGNFSAVECFWSVKKIVWISQKMSVFCRHDALYWFLSLLSQPVYGLEPSAKFWCRTSSEYATSIPFHFLIVKT